MEEEQGVWTAQDFSSWISHSLMNRPVTLTCPLLLQKWGLLPSEIHKQHILKHRREMNQMQSNQGYFLMKDTYLISARTMHLW